MRKLRTEILLLFFFLLLLSCGAILSFAYLRNVEVLRKYSKDTIDQVSALITERMTCLLRALERPPEVGVGVVKRYPELTLDNVPLNAFFIDEVKYHSHLYAYYVGTPAGNALIVFNLSLADKPYYFANPTPPGTVYAVVQVDRSHGEREIWKYLDADLQTIQSEEIPFRGYDPRVRPWYIGAEREKRLFWTDVFVFDPTKDRGIAAAKPIYDDAGELVAIVGADLSLNTFSQFLKDQKIGKQGKAFVLSSSGEILIPDEETLSEPLVRAAYLKYVSGQENDFQFKFGKEKYLASIHKFPKSFGEDWLILIVDPLSDFFGQAYKTQRQMVLICLSILLFASLLVILFARHISLPIVVLSQEVDRITRLDLQNEKRVDSDIEEIRLMDSSIAALRVAIRSFSKYVPKEIIKQLIEEKKEIALGGDKREVTVLFADIIDFTPIAEQYPIETVTSLLAEFFDVLSKVIVERGGTIDKYIGDCIMAFWGAPHPVENGVIEACHAALRCQKELARFNLEREKRNLPSFRCRIGIAAGPVIVGNFGTEERMNYTAIGDAVNTAHRIEQVNKKYQTEILIGEAAQSKIGDQFLVRPIDIVELKGKKKKFKVFELMAEKGEASPAQIELASLFTRAFSAYHEGGVNQARTQFEAILAKFPNDFPTRYYLKLFNP